MALANGHKGTAATILDAEDYKKEQTQKEVERKVHRLFQAVRNGDTEKVVDLIDEGVDINSISGNSAFTCLHWAAWNGHTEIANALISAGADVSAIVSGKTPIDMAVQKRHTATAEAIAKYTEGRQEEREHTKEELSLENRASNINHTDNRGRAIAFY